MNYIFLVGLPFPKVNTNIGGVIGLALLKTLVPLIKIEMIFILITYCTSISKPNHE
jgi:hypothetical protein